jgi:antitoxin ParD1/3/4
MVRLKIESGEYADESDVVCDGLRALQEHDADIERWLREEVAATYDAAISQPGIPAERVFGEAAARYAACKRSLGEQK